MTSTPTSTITVGNIVGTATNVTIQTVVNASTSTPTPAILNPVNTSPKGRFPNNPMLKKKLIGLQKFLAEYTVSNNFNY